MDKFTTKLNFLCEKWMTIEVNDFFRNIPYELSHEEFNKLVDEHDLNDWIPIHCKIHGISENVYRIILWERYTGKSIWDTFNKKFNKT